MPDETVTAMANRPFFEVLPLAGVSEKNRKIIEDHFNRRLLRSREFKERLSKLSAKVMRKILYGK